MPDMLMCLGGGAERGKPLTKGTCQQLLKMFYNYG